MACAHAKFTGEVGVCLATSGPGAIHLLNGLYDAKLDHQPVVAIVGPAGAARRSAAHYQQEVDLLTLFKDVAREYVQMLTVPEQVRHLVDRAIRIAIAERTVTCLIIPNDVQELDACRSRRTRTTRSTPASAAVAPPHRAADRPTCSRAADGAERRHEGAMLVGAGRAGRAGRGDRGRRAARRRRRQGAARQGRRCPTTCPR